MLARCGGLLAVKPGHRGCCWTRWNHERLPPLTEPYWLKLEVPCCQLACLSRRIGKKSLHLCPRNSRTLG